MHDTLLKKPACEAVDLTRDQMTDEATGVRTYPYSPGVMSLQIRSYGNTSQRRGGAAKHIISSAYLDATHAKKLIALLQQFVDEQEA